MPERVKIAVAGGTASHSGSSNQTKKDVEMLTEFSTTQKRRLLQVALWSLAAMSALTGVPAAFAPQTFYDSFPAGLSFVSKLPRTTST